MAQIRIIKRDTVLNSLTFCPEEGKIEMKNYFYMLGAYIQDAPGIHSIQSQTKAKPIA